MKKNQQYVWKHSTTKMLIAFCLVFVLWANDNDDLCIRYDTDIDNCVAIIKTTLNHAKTTMLYNSFYTHNLLY